MSSEEDPTFDAFGVLRIGDVIVNQANDGTVELIYGNKVLMIIPRLGLIPIAKALIKAHVRAGRLPKE